MKKTTEDYLKTIRLLQMKNGNVRSVDLSEAFRVSRPTVSNIVRRLAAEGFISIDSQYRVKPPANEFAGFLLPSKNL